MVEKVSPKKVIRMTCTECLGMSQFKREAVANCRGDQSSVGACPLGGSSRRYASELAYISQESLFMSQYEEDSHDFQIASKLQ